MLPTRIEPVVYSCVHGIHIVFKKPYATLLLLHRDTNDNVKSWTGPTRIPSNDARGQDLAVHARQPNIGEPKGDSQISQDMMTGYCVHVSVCANINTHGNMMMKTHRKCVLRYVISLLHQDHYFFELVRNPSANPKPNARRKRKVTCYLHCDNTCDVNTNIFTKLLLCREDRHVILQSRHTSRTSA